MLPGVLIQVDQTDSCTDGFNYCFIQCFRFSHKCDDQTIMVFIITIIKQFYSGFSTERGYYLIYFLQITSLAKIGDAFNNLIPTHTKYLLL